MWCAEMSIPEKGIFIVYAHKGSFRGPPPTSKRQFGSPCNYVKINLPQRGKFYCEIKFFIYEITSRLLRDKFFYLAVEFILLPREFFPFALELFLFATDCSSVRIIIFSHPTRISSRPLRIYFHPHENFPRFHRAISPFASEFFRSHLNFFSGEIY